MQQQLQLQQQSQQPTKMPRRLQLRQEKKAEADDQQANIHTATEAMWRVVSPGKLPDYASDLYNRLLTIAREEAKESMIDKRNHKRVALVQPQAEKSMRGMEDSVDRMNDSNDPMSAVAFQSSTLSHSSSSLSDSHVPSRCPLFRDGVCVGVSALQAPQLNKVMTIPGRCDRSCCISAVFIATLAKEFKFPDLDRHYSDQQHMQLATAVIDKLTNEKLLNQEERQSLQWMCRLSSSLYVLFFQSARLCESMIQRIKNSKFTCVHKASHYELTLSLEARRRIRPITAAVATSAASSTASSSISSSSDPFEFHFHTPLNHGFIVDGKKCDITTSAD